MTKNRNTSLNDIESLFGESFIAKILAEDESFTNGADTNLSSKTASLLSESENLVQESLSRLSKEEQQEVKQQFVVRLEELSRTIVGNKNKAFLLLLFLAAMASYFGIQSQLFKELKPDDLSPDDLDSMALPKEAQKILLEFGQLESTFADQTLYPAGSINDNGEELLKEAERLHKENKYQEAIEKFKELVFKFPDNALYQYSLGRSYDRFGDYGSSIKALQIATQLDPNNYEYPFRLAHVALVAERGDVALEAVQNMIRLKPDQDHELMLAKAHFLNQDYEESLRLHQDLDKKDKRGLRFYYRLGKSYLETGKYDEAIKYLKNEINLSLRFNNDFCYYDLAWAYFYKGEYDKAINILDRRIFAEKNNSTYYRYKALLSSVAILYYKKKEPIAVGLLLCVKLFLYINSLPGPIPKDVVNKVYELFFNTEKDGLDLPKEKQLKEVIVLILKNHDTKKYDVFIGTLSDASRQKLKNIEQLSKKLEIVLLILEEKASFFTKVRNGFPDLHIDYIINLSEKIFFKKDVHWIDEDFLTKNEPKNLGMGALHWAVLFNDLDKAQLILDRRPELLNHQDAKGRNALESLLIYCQDISEAEGVIKYLAFRHLNEKPDLEEKAKFITNLIVRARISEHPKKELILKFLKSAFFEATLPPDVASMIRSGLFPEEFVKKPEKPSDISPTDTFNIEGAVKGGGFEAVSLTLRQNDPKSIIFGPESFTNSGNSLPLHQKKEIVMFLIANGFDVYLPVKNGSKVEVKHLNKLSVLELEKLLKLPKEIADRKTNGEEIFQQAAKFNPSISADNSVTPTTEQLLLALSLSYVRKFNALKKNEEKIDIGEESDLKILKKILAIDEAAKLSIIDRLGSKNCFLALVSAGLMFHFFHPSVNPFDSSPENETLSGAISETGQYALSALEYATFGLSSTVAYAFQHAVKTASIVAQKLKSEAYDLQMGNPISLTLNPFRIFDDSDKKSGKIYHSNSAKSSTIVGGEKIAEQTFNMDEIGTILSFYHQAKGDLSIITGISSLEIRENGIGVIQNPLPEHLTPIEVKPVSINEDNTISYSDNSKPNINLNGDDLYIKLSVKLEAGKTSRIAIADPSDEFIGITVSGEGVQISKGSDGMYYATSETDRIVEYVLKSDPYASQHSLAESTDPTDIAVHEIIQDYTDPQKGFNSSTDIGTVMPEKEEGETYEKWLEKVFDFRGGRCEVRVAAVFNRIKNRVKDAKVYMLNINGNHVRLMVESKAGKHVIYDLGGIPTSLVYSKQNGNYLPASVNEHQAHLEVKETSSNADIAATRSEGSLEGDTNQGLNTKEIETKKKNLRVNEPATVSEEQLTTTSTNVPELLVVTQEPENLRVNEPATFSEEQLTTTSINVPELLVVTQEPETQKKNLRVSEPATEVSEEQLPTASIHEEEVIEESKEPKSTNPANINSKGKPIDGSQETEDNAFEIYQYLQLVGISGITNSALFLLAKRLYQRRKAANDNKERDLKPDQLHILSLTSEELKSKLSFREVKDNQTALNEITAAKSILYSTKNVETISNIAIKELADQGKQVIYVNSPDAFFDTQSLQIGKNNEVKALAMSPFARDIANLEQGQELAIVVNWQNFTPNQVLSLNTLFDTQASAGTTKIPANTQIISIFDDKNPLKADSSFTSRHDSLISIHDESKKTAVPKVATAAEMTDPTITKIDLQGFPKWEGFIFGPIATEGKKNTWFESDFCKLLKSKQKKFVILNISAEGQKELDIMIKNARSLGYLTHHGIKIPIPADLEVIFAEEKFDMQPFNQSLQISAKTNVLYQSQSLPEDLTIANTHLFDQLLERYRIEGGLYFKKQGLIEEKRNGVLNLFLTPPQLSEQQFYCLLAHAKKFNVGLNFYLAKGVTLPPNITPKEIPDISFKINRQAKLPQIFVTNNPEQVLTKVTNNDKKPYAVVSVEDFSYASLFSGPNFDLGEGGTTYENFRVEISEFAQRLMDGERIILKGQFSQHMLSILHNIFCSGDPNFQKIGDNLIVIVEDESIAKGSTTYQPLSFLPTCTVEHFDQDNKKDKNPPITETSEANEAIDLEDSERKTQEFFQGRITMLTNLMQTNPIVMISGPSGVGKTQLLELMKGKGFSIFNEMGNFESWSSVEGETTLVIDESNTAQSHLMTFDPMKYFALGNEEQQMVRLLNGKQFYEVGREKKVVLLCNPINYSSQRIKQKLVADGKVPIIEFGEFPSYCLYEILKEKVYNNLNDWAKQLINEEQFQEHCKGLIINYKKFNLEKRRLGDDAGCMTVRELEQQALHFVRSNFTQDQQLRIETETFVSTNATVKVERSLNDFLTLRDLQIDGIIGNVSAGLNAFIIQGSPGLGKTEMIISVMKQCGMYQGDPTKETESLWCEKKYCRITAAMSDEEIESTIIAAAKWGYVILCDELDAISSKVEKYLNAVLTGISPKGDPNFRVDPKVRVIASVNGSHEIGRGAISPAIKHRSEMHRYPELSEFKVEDLHKIVLNQLRSQKLRLPSGGLKKEEFALSVAKGFLSEQLKVSGEGNPNLRDLVKKLPDIVKKYADYCEQHPSALTKKISTTRLEGLGMTGKFWHN